MLENDRSRQLFEPELNQKTDTILYALGILQGIQELADQYVFQGEMRGDLVQTTMYTDNNLRQLADFSATTENRYDSAYVYYRVINNCNYYIAHVDTTLRTGADNVMMSEYVAVKAIRAWTYMQLARVYGRVPFYTEPLTQISQIDGGNYPELDMSGIVSALAPDLEQYAGEKLFMTPNYGSTPNGAGFNPGYIFMPVDVVLGEMYLETGDYARAANHYIRYLTRVAPDNNRYTAYVQPYTPSGNVIYLNDLPSDFDLSNLNGFSGADGLWETIFRTTTDIITYIPMATSKLRGATTVLPKTFGYDYYATDKSGESRYIDEVQIVASPSYLNLTNSQDFYYLSSASTTSNTIVNSARLGDQRYNAIIHERENAETDSTQVWITTFNTAVIPLFRTTTVWLHLAEAFNRLGMPDAAFAILKDGIKDDPSATYNYFHPNDSMGRMSSMQFLEEVVPFLSRENKAKFKFNWGIHSRGTNYTQGAFSGYQLDTLVAQKMAELQTLHGIAPMGNLNDTINAVEDLICDEMALELAFEGSRFGDLTRMARHKNKANWYTTNFGSQWLAAKLAYKQPRVSLLDEKNWYLPF